VAVLYKYLCNDGDDDDEGDGDDVDAISIALVHCGSVQSSSYYSMCCKCVLLVHLNNTVSHNCHL